MSRITYGGASLTGAPYDVSSASMEYANSLRVRARWEVSEADSPRERYIDYLESGITELMAF